MRLMFVRPEKIVNETKEVKVIPDSDFPDRWICVEGDFEILYHDEISDDIYNREAYIVQLRNGRKVWIRWYKDYVSPIFFLAIQYYDSRVR